MRMLQTPDHTKVLKFSAILGFIIITIPHVVWMVMGEDSFLRTWDNLDSEFVYIKLVRESGNLFAFNLNGTVDQIMNGVPRVFFRTGFNLTFLLFSIVTDIYAYILNHYLAHVIGFFGMFLLLRYHFNNIDPIIIFLVSLTYGFLGYFHLSFGISISGQPILLYAFLNVYKGVSSWRDWLIILVFPLFSFLPMTIPFFLPVLILIGIVLWKKYKDNFPKYLIVIGLFVLVSFLVEFPLTYSLIGNHDFVSHRTAWATLDFYGEPSVSQVITDVKKGFTYTTNVWAGRLKIYPVVMLLIAYLIIFRSRSKRVVVQLFILVSGIILFSALKKTIILLFGNTFEIINYFHFDRFAFLEPLIWLLILAVILNDLILKYKYLRIPAFLMIMYISVSPLKANSEFTFNLKLLTNRPIGQPTFKQFFAEDLFNELKNDLNDHNLIGKNTLNIGIYPSVAQYNGLKTLDSYQNNYLLSYKYEFRKIIAHELEAFRLQNSFDQRDWKTQIIDVSTRFDAWGSECYTFTSELGSNKISGKNTDVTLENLNLDLDHAKNMGCGSIISTVPIDNPDKINLQFISEYSSPSSYWRIYLYKVL